MTKYLLILLTIVAFACGEPKEADEGRVCIFSPNINCIPDDIVAEEAAGYGLHCEVLNGEFAFCGDPMDVNAAITMTSPTTPSAAKQLSSILVSGRREGLDVDF